MTVYFIQRTSPHDITSLQAYNFWNLAVLSNADRGSVNPLVCSSVTSEKSRPATIKIFDLANDAVQYPRKTENSIPWLYSIGFS